MRGCPMKAIAAGGGSGMAVTVGMPGSGRCMRCLRRGGCGMAGHGTIQRGGLRPAAAQEDEDGDQPTH